LPSRSLDGESDTPEKKKSLKRKGKKTSFVFVPREVLRHSCECAFLMLLFSLKRDDEVIRVALLSFSLLSIFLHLQVSPFLLCTKRHQRQPERPRGFFSFSLSSLCFLHAQRLVIWQMASVHRSQPCSSVRKVWLVSHVIFRLFRETIKSRTAKKGF